jgi:transposase
MVAMVQGEALADRYKRGIARTQTALLPATIEDYAGANSVVRVIDAYVNGLDMFGLGFAKSVVRDTGRPPYAPDDLLRLYLYGYWSRIRGSRILEVECKRNLELIWLMGGLVPDHKIIADFRRLNAKPFQAACRQFVQFLRELKLVGGEAPVVAVDGSKFKACAAKSSLLSAEQLAKERAKIDRRIEEYLQAMDEADRKDPGETPLSVEQIEQALERLRERDRKLEQGQAELAAREQPKGRDHTPRVSLTDPDCVMLTGKGTALAGYNVQHAVDVEHKLIVAHEVTTCGNDHTSLGPMAIEAQEALGAQQMTALADTGYANGAQSEACEARGITPVVPMPQVSHTSDGALYPKTVFAYDEASDTYRCPAGAILSRYKHDRTAQTDYYWTNACHSCEHKARCTKSERRSIARSWFAAAAERAHERAQGNRELMRLRSASAEHPFGTLKAMLPGGFLVRTMAKVKGEMALAVLTYNLKRTLKILGFDELMRRLALQTQMITS